VRGGPPFSYGVVFMPLTLVYTPVYTVSSRDQSQQRPLAKVGWSPANRKTTRTTDVVKMVSVEVHVDDVDRRTSNCFVLWTSMCEFCFAGIMSEERERNVSSA